VVSLAGVTTAFAQSPNDYGAIVAPDEDNPVQATITKNLRMPIGTTTPSVTFHFLATPISVDGRTDETDRNTMPDLNPAALTVSFTAADVDPTDPPTNIMSIRKETGDLFYGVTFPHAGIFVYEIRELRPTNLGIDASQTEWLYYSEAVYTLTVYVKNHSDGGTFVHAVGTRIITDDLGEPGNGKLDPTPGGNGEDYFFSQMAFRNDYVKIDNPEDPDPVEDTTLFVSKTVAGDFGDRTQYFDFTMTLTVPEIVRDAPPHYRAYIVENGAVIDPSNNTAAGLIGTDAEGLRYIRVSTSGETDFTLRHGQKLVFVDTPVGTRYTVNEDVAANYTPNVTVTTDGVGVNIPGTINSPLSTGNQFAGEGLNSATFTNTRDSVTPTGLNLNNLPFVGLIALGIGGLVAFLVVKSRKRKYYTITDQ